jgi:hypothetical protein
MTARLAAGSSCFAFMTQLQTDPATTPIDDSTILWNTVRCSSRFASITIPRQRFDSAEQQAFCENLSCTAWHVLPVHRPLDTDQ